MKGSRRVDGQRLGGHVRAQQGDWKLHREGAWNGEKQRRREGDREREEETEREVRGLCVLTASAIFFESCS